MQKKRGISDLIRDAEYAGAIIDTLGVPLLILDGFLAVTDVNKDFYNHFNVDPDETLGRKVFELGNGQWNIPKLRELLEQVLPDRNPIYDFEVEHTFEQLGHRVMTLNAVALPYGKKPELILVAIRDRTPERTYQKQLERAKQTLEHQKQQLQRLASETIRIERRERKPLAAMLHDHLQQLLVASKMQLDRAANADDGRQVRDAVTRCQTLNKESIDAARRLIVELRPPILYEAGFAAALQWLATHMLDRYDLKVDVHISDGFGLENGDLNALLFDSIRELLFNVVKHAGQSEATVEVRREGERVRISVEDRGRGFDLQSWEQNPSLHDGLGLFSIRERVRVLDGEMTIITAPAEGTRIEVVVPMPTAVETQALRTSSDTPHRHRPTRGRARVLVVDDHELVREGLTNIINQHPCFDVVAQASDGLEAIKVIERYRPDLVTMDVNMPGLSGIEATRMIAQRYPNVVIIGLTVQDDEATARVLKEAGAKSVISKACDPNELVTTLLEGVKSTPGALH